MAPILDSLHGSLLNPREFLYPAITMRFLKGNDVNVGIFSLLL